MLTPLEISLCIVIAVMVVGLIVQAVMHSRELRDTEVVADMWQTAAQRHHAQLIEARRGAESVSDALTTTGETP